MSADMIEHRGHVITTETHVSEAGERRTHTIIIPPSGDAWITYRENPESEIDEILDEAETMEETYERNEDQRRQIWELI